MLPGAPERSRATNRLGAPTSLQRQRPGDDRSMIEDSHPDEKPSRSSRELPSNQKSITVISSTGQRVRTSAPSSRTTIISSTRIP